MPNIKSAMKRVRISQKKTANNKSQKSELRTMMKKARAAAETPSAETAPVLRTAQARLDKAVAKGHLHKNTASRKKSRLAKAANRNS